MSAVALSTRLNRFAVVTIRSQSSSSTSTAFGYQGPKRFANTFLAETAFARVGAYATARSSSLASRCSRSRESEPSAQAIRNRVKQADLDDGRRDDGLTSQEQEEPKQLRRENKQLRLEREILAKAARRAIHA